MRGRLLLRSRWAARLCAWAFATSRAVCVSLRFSERPHFCPRALGSQDTTSTHPLGRLILHGALGPMQTPWLQRLTRRPAVNVLHWIIPKRTLRENTLASDVILLCGSIPDVTCRPALSARHVVLLRPVLVISHRHFHMASCVLLMLLN